MQRTVNTPMPSTVSEWNSIKCVNMFLFLCCTVSCMFFIPLANSTAVPGLLVHPPLLQTNGLMAIFCLVWRVVRALFGVEELSDCEGCLLQLLSDWVALPGLYKPSIPSNCISILNLYVIGWVVPSTDGLDPTISTSTSHLLVAGSWTLTFWFSKKFLLLNLFPFDASCLLFLMSFCSWTLMSLLD